MAVPNEIAELAKEYAKNVCKEVGNMVFRMGTIHTTIRYSTEVNELIITNDTTKEAYTPDNEYWYELCKEIIKYVIL